MNADARDVVRRIYSAIHGQPVDPWAAPQGPGRWAEEAERIIGEVMGAGADRPYCDDFGMGSPCLNLVERGYCAEHDPAPKLATATAKLAEWDQGAWEGMCDDLHAAQDLLATATAAKEAAEARCAALESEQECLSDAAQHVVDAVNHATTAGDSGEIYAAAEILAALLTPAAPREAGGA